MKRWVYRTTALLLLMAFSCLSVISSCRHSMDGEKAGTSVLISSECRTIEHKLGKLCIPSKPKRIIALDPRYVLDPLLAFGINPVGFASYVEQGKIYLAGVSSDSISSIESVGQADRPSLEKIAMLKPDLIVALDLVSEQNYEQLSAIAPTVLIDYDKIKYSFKKNIQFLARLFNQEKRAKEVIEQYQKRIEVIQSQLGNQRHTMNVSVMFQSQNRFWLTSNESGISQVLTDIGITHKSASSNDYEFSIETIDAYDADVLFISSVNRQPLSIFQNSLVSSLKAVKSGRAYVVDPDIWWAYGPLGIDRLLDDLEKHLVKAF